MEKVKALVSTIKPVDGGVPTMTRWICKLLSDYNITPVLAWYEPWRNQPKLSVPIYRILGNTPKSVNQEALEQYEGIGIGSWLPELEFTHYLPTAKWKELVAGCQLHLSVSGNPLCALPFILLKVPFIAWIATPWEADRTNRVNSFRITRRILDSIVNKPILTRTERKILRSQYGQIISLSNYTSREFSRISGRCISDVMFMPVNSRVFYPDYATTKRMRVGFTGRYCDPRKNIRLLLHATKILVLMGYSIELFLIGDKDFKQLLPTINDFQLEGHVKCYAHKEPAELASLLRTLDIFVIPSFQEGLCISALEAMACGVPIISTRCGGPEDYVIQNETGRIIDSDPNCLAKTILEITLNRETRDRLAINATDWITRNASEENSRSIFESHLERLMDRTNQKVILQDSSS